MRNQEKGRFNNYKDEAIRSKGFDRSSGAEESSEFA
jgi:hypothetical protein